MPQQTHHEWLAAQPFTLALSAGFFGFYAHTGFLQALAQSGLKPRRIVGVSAGALAGGIYASGVPLEALRETLLALRREAFWDVGRPGLSLVTIGLLKGRKFDEVLTRVLENGGVKRVEDCPIPFSPVVFDVLSRQTGPVREGLLSDAIRASCALPGLFRPVRVGDRLYLDGGIRDRGGLTALQDDERALLHHLPSKSPWRLVSGTQPLVDSAIRRTMILPALPRVGPFSLDVGVRVLDVARDETLRWLNRRVE